MAAILDTVAILEKKHKKITSNKDLPHQLFQKVRTSNVIYFTLPKRIESFFSRPSVIAADGDRKYAFHDCGSDIVGPKDPLGPIKTQIRKACVTAR